MSDPKSPNKVHVGAPPPPGADQDAQTVLGAMPVIIKPPPKKPVVEAPRGESLVGITTLKAGRRGWLLTISLVAAVVSMTFMAFQLFINTSEPPPAAAPTPSAPKAK